METSPSETSGDSLPKTDSAVSASCARRVRGKRAARDAALGPLHEEEASQFSRGEPPAKRRAHGLSERCSAKANDLSSCSFLRNLWEVTESDRFQSIWWGDEGDFIVIEEPFFRTEVLARRGPHKLFSFESMTTFVRHLHHHGFFITEADLASCASRARLQGEGAAFSTCSEKIMCMNVSRIEKMEEKVSRQIWDYYADSDSSQFVKWNDTISPYSVSHGHGALSEAFAYSA
ncbi:hypothetical protein ASZ78_016592 [Callipepla squamata]|uniref:HSF-type DNA-binding domain-containing protein n=1 Tax=Callipepla squamata TaxID=9009 RepID=A0A226MDU6_CALSU|nr:hypothetical protein ASZ78_016592 [Callipepla squamata]